MNLLFIACAVLSLLFIESVNCEKLQSKTQNNLSECSSCRLLVKSFQYWLQKTSRGKFEGGDANWEENKLKSYPRSEVRLVEIQENLCSELTKHQDDCYAIAERSEVLIDAWWNDNNPDEAELSPWLCTESLGVCCPKGHYGTSCLKCGECGENMQCDGEGTRRGSGKCICSKGFNMIDGVCRVIEVCKPNSCPYNKFCRIIEGKRKCLPCHSTCMKCSGPDRTDCIECPHNYVHSYSGACINSHSADSKEFSRALMVVLPSTYIALKVAPFFFKSRIMYFILFQVLFIAVHYYYGLMHLFVDLIYDFLEYTNILSLWRT